ncbi:radical SAM protein [Candidatus Woesearchaeota archaeon]|nr:radical SAM protein [Candidatus Woesearchaeota archaeon]
MAELSFETLAFKEETDRIKVTLLNQFYFHLNKEDLAQIAQFKINPHQITFSNISQTKAEKKFRSILDKGLKELKSLITHNSAVYVHQNSGIPLLGNVSFGLVYRNTSLIEIKPMTGCNLNCIYCSVGEGINSKKTDFVVEKDYLIQEFQKLLPFAGESVEAHIGTHGEPFLYGDIIPLIADLNNFKQVHTVSLDTNGTLLSKKIIDQLKNFKKVRLNISLNTLNPKTASTIAGVPYNLDKTIEVIKYAKNKVQILLTPLMIPTYNDSEIEELVKFAKENKLEIGIQNFLTYKTGRNPTKPWPWEKFYSLLKSLEQKYSIKLVYAPEDFKIAYTEKLPLPFQMGDIVSATIISPDRFPHSRLAVAKGRTISIPDCQDAINKRVQVKITRDKHNIFSGKVI